MGGQLGGLARNTDVADGREERSLTEGRTYRTIDPTLVWAVHFTSSRMGGAGSEPWKHQRGKHSIAATTKLVGPTEIVNNPSWTRMKDCTSSQIISS